MLMDMDLLILSLVLALVLIRSLIFFTFTCAIDHNDNLPPGKLGWPIIGETWEFVVAGRKGNLGKFLNDRISKYKTNVFKTSLFGEKMVVFCGAEGNKFLFSNENKLVKLCWPTHMKKLFFSPNSNLYSSSSSSSDSMDSPDQSTRTRRFLSEFVKPEALKNYIPIMDSIARQHLERECATTTPKGLHVKVYPLSKNYTFELACRLFMSIESCDHVERFSDQFALVSAGILSMPIDFPGTTFNRAIKAANKLCNELRTFIKRRRNHLMEHEDSERIPDLLSHMLLESNNEHHKFTSELDIAYMILGTLIASHDTTSTVITFVLYYLADHPLVYDEVLKEQMEIKKSKGEGECLNWQDIQKMKYSKNVINEAMRLNPPSLGNFKEALTKFNYAGFSIPKGWKIHWNVYSTHEDPKYFPNPEKFDPSRFEGKGPMPFTFVPFGGGSRICPGADFARLVVLALLHNLVTRFKWEKLIPNEKIIRTPFPIPEKGLPIRLYPIIS